MFIHILLRDLEQVKSIKSCPFLNSFNKVTRISFLLWKYTSESFLSYSSVTHNVLGTHLLRSKAKCIHVTIITAQWLSELCRMPSNKWRRNDKILKITGFAITKLITDSKQESSGDSKPRGERLLKNGTNIFKIRSQRLLSARKKICLHNGKM